MHKSPRLVATYYTLAGPVLPGLPDASPFSLRERAEAAGKAGYVGLGMSGYDLEACVSRHSYSEIRNILAGAGISFLEFECLAGWFDDGERRRESDCNRRLWFKYAEKLGAQHIKVVGDPPGSSWGIEHMANSFRGLCREAGEIGLMVSIEIFPISNIADIKTGRLIMEHAETANGGLLLDIWHLTRMGIPYEEIASIPLRYIKHVELNDADTEVVGDLFHDTVHHRQLPGEGSFDVVSFLRNVADTGYDGFYGIEILSDKNRLRTPDEAARLSFDAAMVEFAKLQRDKGVVDAQSTYGAGGGTPGCVRAVPIGLYESTIGPAPGGRGGLK